MIQNDSHIINLWHGLGLLKKTVVNTKKFVVGTMVCSSEDCVSEYSKHFKISQANVLPLGSVQTDILFDKENLIKKRKYITVFKTTIALNEFKSIISMIIGRK